jgi:hypothetical protein
LDGVQTPEQTELKEKQKTMKEEHPTSYLIGNDVFKQGC